MALLCAYCVHVRGSAKTSAATTHRETCMSFARAVALAVLLFGSSAFAQGPPPPRDVTISAADGTRLKATYYAAARPGPAVLLLHMCNTTRKSWEPLGPQLAAAGIHALSVDYRGFGESGGDRFDPRGRGVPDHHQREMAGRHRHGLRFPAGATRRGQDAGRRRRRELRRQPCGAAGPASPRGAIAGAARGPTRR